MNHNGWIDGIKCPICLEDLNVRATFSPGFPGSRDSPPEGPELENWEVGEPNCDCRGNLLHAESYDNLVNELIEDAHPDSWKLDTEEEEFDSEEI